MPSFSIVRVKPAIVGVATVQKTRRPPVKLLATGFVVADGLHVVTNADDFILGDENLDWLRGVVGERLTVFPDGGHLGNLHLEPMRQAIVDALGVAQGAAE